MVITRSFAIEIVVGGEWREPFARLNEEKLPSSVLLEENWAWCWRGFLGKHQPVQEPRISFGLERSKYNHFGNENWAILWILEGVILLLRTLRERACLMHFEFKFLNDVLINFYAPLENKYDVFTPMDKVDRLPFNDVEALMGNITTKIATNCFLKTW